MKFELEGLDHLIKTVITPNKLVSTAPNPIKIEEWVTFVENEKVRICQAFVIEVYQHNLNRKAEQYIQTHQISLSNLTDCLEAYLKEVEGSQLLNGTTSEFYHHIAALLDSITSFLQGYLNRYIDSDMSIPQGYSQLLKQEFEKTISVIEKPVENSGIENSLWQIPLRPLKNFPQNCKISFRKAEYLRELAKDLLEVKEIEAQEDAKRKLHELLHRSNFNAPEYIFFCTSALDRKLEKIEEQNGKLEFLEWYIKTINQLTVREDFEFVPGLPTVSHQILKWIQEEYRYIIGHNNPVNGNTAPASPIDKKENGAAIKINTTWTVPQLAVWVKLHIKSGSITNASIIEVIRFVAKNFTSVKSDEISEESLRSKFYNTEASAKDSVNDYLIEYRNLLKSENF